MSEQNANMTLSDTPEKIFSGEVGDAGKTDFQQECQEWHERHESHEELEINEKGADKAIKSETGTICIETESGTETGTKTETDAETNTESLESVKSVESIATPATPEAPESKDANLASDTVSATTASTSASASASTQAKSMSSISSKSSSPLSRVNFVNIPRALKSSCSFCVWRKEKRNGKAIKIPYDPKTGQMAKTNDPSTFSDFATAMKVYALGTATSHWDGIGFRVSEGIGAIDIDHCLRPDGSLNDVAASILSFLKNAYFERSPSGTGLRGLFRLDADFTYDKTRYYINNRRFGLEVYFPGVTNRFVILGLPS